MGPVVELRAQLRAQNDELSMALTHLLPLLDRPPAPTLSLDTRYTVYLPGERVTLTCSAPEPQRVSGYRFFSQEGQQDPSVVQHPNEGARLELTAEKGNAGTYTCAYWRQESNREISSRNSNSVSIRVTDTPAAPTLSLSPPRWLYLTGESVRLTCSPPRGDEAVTRFQFYKYRGSIISPDVLSNSGATNFKLKLEDSGSYTCLYWIHPSGREIPSVKSAPVSISVRDPPPAPTLSLDPEYTVYLPGERVTLTCSAPGSELDWRYRFFYQGQQDPSVVQPPNEGARLELTAEKGNAGTYTCAYWRQESYREISSRNSSSVSIPVTDPPPQPALSVDPPSGVVSEGIPLLITCTAPRNTGQQRFHFYKDRAELIPGDVGSEINATEPRTVSMNTSVLRIPLNSSNNTGEFSCGYEENVGGRWIPSPRSWAVTVTGNVTVSARSFLWVRELVVGGSFFLINGLIFLVSHCCF
nr:alpha-1B-glycoprotein-like [Chrysemys picta bellii]